MSEYASKLSHQLLLLFLCCILVACSTIEPVHTPGNSATLPFSVRYDELFNSQPDIVSRQEVHQLSTQQEQHFLDYYHAKVRENIPANQSVADYIEHFVESFTYKNETNIARKTMAHTQGNCLSLAILTTSLAELANVRVGYQLTDSIPVFHLNDAVIFKGLHIRSMLFDPNFIDEEGLAQPRSSGIQIDYFPTGTERYRGNVSKDGFTARYYLNLAATAISKEDYSTAYWLTLKSMEYVAKSSDAFNTMGVIYKRIGEYPKAEEIYRYGIEHLPEKLSLLKNYRILLELQNRNFEARLITQRINVIHDSSPFDLIYAAQEYYDQGKYSRAIKLYKKALDLAPHIHQVRLALAQSHYQAGHYRAARIQLQQAVTLANSPSTQTLYQAKLNSLNHEFE